MSVETNASFISELNEGYPRKNDLLREGDDHIRLVKTVLKNTLPGFTKTINITADKLNRINTIIEVTDTTLKILGNLEIAPSKVVNFNNNRITKIAPPVDEFDAVHKGYLSSGEGIKFSWPIGSIYLTVDVRNPKDIFGFGEWVVFSAGRMIVGAGTTIDDGTVSRTFVVNEIGGKFSHTLTTDEIPSHTHATTDLTLDVAEGGEHRHTLKTTTRYMSLHDIPGQWFEGVGNTDIFTEVGGKHKHTGKVSGVISSTGGGKAVNLMNPYISVFMWKRTA